MRAWSVVTGGALVASLTIGTAVEAAAQAAPVIGSDDLGNNGTTTVAVLVGGDEVTTEALEQAASTSGQRYMAVPTAGADPDGNWCRAIRWEAIADDADVDTLREDAEVAYHQHFVATAPFFFEDPADQLAYANTPCPTDPAAALPEAVVRERVAQVAFQQVPRPTLSIPPDHGLAGLRMYLVTGHQLDHGPVSVTLDFDILQLEVTFTAEGESVVDWGDGTVTTHRTGGGPYPDGQVTHVYTHEGLYDVTVTDRWVVDYDVAGRVTGQVQGTLDPVTLPDFPVNQRQAVRTD